MHRRRPVSVLLIVVSILLGQVPTPAGAVGAVRRVATNGKTTGTCNTWPNACKLQYALTIAGPGDSLWVKAGTHKPGTLRTDTFTLKDGVSIYGGFAGGETKLNQRNYKSNVTVLSGAIGTSSAADNSYHVVTGGGTNSFARLDGFTITGGNANGTAPHHVGGGMNNVASSPTLVNLIFKGNAAPGSIPGEGCGGGMYNGNSSSPSLSKVTFKNNTSTDGCGGGMYDYDHSSPTVVGVAFISNAAYDGGGLYNYLQSAPVLDDVTFVGNTAIDDGGGMYNNQSNPSLTKVTFKGNHVADGDGGGVFNDLNTSPSFNRVTFTDNSAVQGGGMYNDGSDPTISDVTFSGNSATADGGGMFNKATSVTMERITFSNNEAVYGGGVFVDDGGATLANVTFKGNSALHGGGIGALNSLVTLHNATLAANSSTTGSGVYIVQSSTLHVNNSIIWGTGILFYNFTSSWDFTDSIISNGCPLTATCTNVLSSNPRLDVLASNGGYTKTMALKAGSPAIDSGGVNSPCEPTDQRGVLRPQGAACDIGAYEKK